MRVAFLAYRGSMQSGGLGIYLHALTRQLAERGVEIDLYVGPSGLEITTPIQRDVVLIG